MKFLSDILIKAGLVVEGSTQLNSLAGVGSRMVIVSSSGVLSTQSLPTANITGGGTAGQVAYFDASNNIVSDNGLNYDSANGRLSIGGTSNSYKLNVLGVPDGTIGQVILATTGRLNIYAYHSAQYGVILESKNPNDVGSLPITLSGSTVNLLGTPILSSFIGAGTRMVVADATGTLSTQAIPTSSVVSVFGRSGTVTAQAGDYNTSQVSEVGNLYYTDARSRAAISVVGSGAYNSSTGVITINGGVTSVNGATGAVTLTTANIGEVTNLYYTDARSRAAISVTGSGSYNSTTGVITINGGVTSVNGLTGAVTLTTSNIAEGTNLYYTDARARAAISLTTTGSSGAATYSAGVLNVPNYTLAGLGGIAGTIASGQVAYGTAADTIGGSNNLFWDAATSRLGIGTNTPARQLVIYDGSSGVPHVQWANASTGVTNGDGFQIRLLSTNQVHFTNFENSAMYFGNQGITGQMTLFSTGNLALGVSATDDGVNRLQVSGNALIKGSGNTSASTALTVQNSDATNLFRVRNDGSGIFRNGLFFGTSTNNLIISSNASNTADVAGLNLSILFGSFDTAGYGVIIGGFNASTRTVTSGASGTLQIGHGYAPTSGTGRYTMLNVIGTINQTGGANGITRGLYVNPALTAAADWRSIEWSNNSGWGLYGAGTANSYFGGSVGIGSTSLTARSLSIERPITGSTNPLTITARGSIQSDATGNVRYFNVATFSQAATFTTTNVIAYEAEQGALGAGHTVTNQIGFQVSSSLTGATNNYGFYGNIASGTGRWNLYMNGTAINYLNGALLIGSATNDTVNKLQVTGTIVAGSTTSTNGSVILRGSYTNGYLTTFGTDASSGGPMISYGVESAQNSTAGAFVSSSGITIPRSAYVQTGGHTWYTATSSTTAVGTAITMTKYMELYNSGNLVLGGAADVAGNRIQVNGNSLFTGTINSGAITATSVQGNGIIRSDASRTAATNDVSIALLGSNITTYAAGFSMGAAGYGLNAIYAQHEQRFGGNAQFSSGNLVGGGLILNKLAPTAAGTVTMDQIPTTGTVTNIRTMSNLHLMTQFQGNNNLTVTHMSGLHIYGHYRTSGTGTLTVSTAYYGIFLADPNEFGTGATVTGANWGFYQQGAAPTNYFGGKVNIGTTTIGTSPLRVSGLPTSAAGLGAGEVWNNGGVLTIV